MSKKSIWLFTGTAVLTVLALTLLSLLGVRLYQDLSGQAEEPRPPDLTDCTRIEIRRGALPQAPMTDDRDANLLTPEEARSLESVIRLTVVENPLDIVSLAHEVLLAKCERIAPEHERFPDHLYVTAYLRSGQTVSFFMYSVRLETEDGHVFTNPMFPHCLAAIRSEVWPFQWRTSCAAFIAGLMNPLRKAVGEEHNYPAATEWCDVVEQRTRDLPRIRVTWSLSCPAQREGRCHYAMNSNCKPDSPPDMVLLFETKAGWNQHGGPELFTFDNHYPRGGCVLFNDGTVKFIRTEEELKQLRWN